MIDTGAPINGAPIQNGSLFGNQHVMTNAIKTRQEVLAEQKFEKSLKRKKGGKKDLTPEQQARQEEKEKNRLLHKKIKQFYSDKGFTPRFETRGGEKVES